MNDLPTMSQYFWWKKGCKPSGPGALKGWKENTACFISSIVGVSPILFGIIKLFLTSIAFPVYGAISCEERNNLSKNLSVMVSKLGRS